MAHDEPGQLDDGLVGWMTRYGQKHFWRVVTDRYDFDDLIQDGYCIACDCRARYVETGQAKNQAHFMSLFKRCFSNHITDLAAKRSRLVETPASQLGAEDEPDEDAFGVEDEIATFMVSLRRAPEEIRKVVGLLLSQEGLNALQAPVRLRLDGTRETTHARLCRLIGETPWDGDLPQAIRNYFA